MTAGERPSVLRFEATGDVTAPAGSRVVVLDTTWTPSPGDGRVGLRLVAERALRLHDAIAEPSELLDAWVEAAGVVAATTVDGTSFWYYGRLRYWAWLQRRLIWLWVLEELLRDGDPDGIACGPGVDRELVEVARLVAVDRGVPFDDEAPVTSTSGSTARPEPPSSTLRSSDARAVTNGMPAVLRRLTQGLRRHLRPDRATRDRRMLVTRLARLEQDPGRLLVVLQHAEHRVEIDSVTRMMNVYLDPIADRLRGSRLDPVAVHTVAASHATAGDVAGWHDRVLPGAILRAIGQAGDERDELAADIADRVASITAPLAVAGIDLGPALAFHVAAQLRESLPAQLRRTARIRRLLERLRPVGILMAAEYQRQDWLGPAAAQGIPVVAVQHGVIHRWHGGYIYPSGAAGLRLPDRLYVFGPWERRLLIEHSVFEPERVRVGGSPRLDLAARSAPEDPAVIRAELGVAPTDRMVVISGTWGAVARRFQVPISLARIVDRPLPRVHLVVKLHPGETDDGPYRAVIEGTASAGGFDAPPITVVRTVDLYRALRAADAHLGFQSTVLTEAVVTGTRNLLADVEINGDVLGWVDAGVAVPIRDGADLLAALDDPTTIPTEAARRAFLADHFEPGDASGRIAAELLDWLPVVDAPPA